MSLVVIWSNDALHDAQKIFDYIAAENPSNAHLVADRLEHTLGLLADTPFGRPGRVPNTYETVVPKTPFILSYAILKNRELYVLRVIHRARHWPEGNWPK